MSDEIPRSPAAASGQQDRLELAAAIDDSAARARMQRAPTYYPNTLLDPDQAHLLHYVRVLYKRRWVALTAFLLVVGSVSVYSFTATRVYEARVQLLIEKESSNVVNFKEAFEQNKITDDYYQTQYKVLQSRGLARRTIEALNLWNHPMFKADASTSRLSVSRIVMWPVTASMRLLAPKDPPPTKEASETADQSRIIDRFLAGMIIAPVRSTRLVDIRYDSSDPLLATQIVNAHAKAFIEQNLEYKFTASKEASDWLGERLSEQRKQVEASEQALQRYRERSDAVSLEDRQNIVVQKLTELNAAVTRAKTERIQKETLYSQMRNIQNDRGALDTLPIILSNGYIQAQKAELAQLQQQQAQMAEKLGERHPDMVKVRTAIQSVQAKIQGEIGKTVQAVGNDYRAAQAQEQSLMIALDQQKQEALSLNRKAIDYGVLQRDSSTNRQIFDSLLQRTKETGISGELKSSNIRIVDPAEVPSRPSSPNTSLNMTLALFSGLALGLTLTFFFEYMDSRIKTPDEIRQYLRLPYLGMIPALFDEAIKSPLINNGVPASFVEAFKSVRTNMLFSSADHPSMSISVTSTGPNEGKTVVASNIAMALAQAGQRVLLIDADMRKPRVQEVFNITQKPGLSDVLVGTSRASEAVQKSGVVGLWILPAGIHPPNPTELLGTKRFKDFIATVSQHFEWIIIDTPPVMAVTDSCVIGHITDGVLFVVGAERTSRHAAQRALEQLAQVNAKVIGSVLNRVDLQHNAYYYSQYYRREYGTYYATAS